MSIKPLRIDKGNRKNQNQVSTREPADIGNYDSFSVDILDDLLNANETRRTRLLKKLNRKHSRGSRHASKKSKRLAHHTSQQHAFKWKSSETK